MCYVYRHIFPDGKVYVGMCRRHPEVRWMEGEGYLNNKELYTAINKYGWDNIRHEIVGQNLTEEEALAIESLLIDLHNSGDEHSGYNKTTSTKRSQSREIAQYDLQGNLLATYPSANAAGRAIGTSGRNLARAAANRRVSYNFIWKYTDDSTEIIPPTNVIARKRNPNCALLRPGLKTKPVIQFDLDGNFLDRFASISEATRITGVSSTCISGACRGDKSTAKIIRRTAGGFLWKYEKEGE